MARSFIFTPIKCALALYLLFLVFWTCPLYEPVPLNAPIACTPLHLISAPFLNFLQPYYNEYAFPYYQIIEPYLDKVSIVFNKYGNPILVKSHGLFFKYFYPHITKYGKQVEFLYLETIHPTVNNYLQIVLSPYYTYIFPHLDFASKQVNNYVLPTVNFFKDKSYIIFKKIHLLTKPAVISSGRAVKTFYTEKALPNSIQAMKFSYNFLKESLVKLYLLWVDTIAPKVGSIYSEKVKPQLLRIYQHVVDSKNSTSEQMFLASNENDEKQTFISSSISSTTSVPTDTEPLYTIQPVDITQSVISDYGSILMSGDIDITKSTTSPFHTETTTTILYISTPLTDLDSDSLNTFSTTSTFNVNSLSMGKTVNKNTADYFITKDELNKVSEHWNKIFNDAGENAEKGLKNDFEEIYTQVLHETTTAFNKMYNDLLITVDEYILELSKIAQEQSREEFFARTSDIAKDIHTNVQTIRLLEKEAIPRYEIATLEARKLNLGVFNDVCELGFNELGKKIAWFENVSWDDWKKFHSLRVKTEETKKRLESFEDPYISTLSKTVDDSLIQLNHFVSYTLETLKEIKNSINFVSSVSAETLETSTIESDTSTIENEDKTAEGVEQMETIDVQNETPTSIVSFSTDFRESIELSSTTSTQEPDSIEEFITPTPNIEDAPSPEPEDFIGDNYEIVNEEEVNKGAENLDENVEPGLSDPVPIAEPEDEIDSVYEKKHASLNEQDNDENEDININTEEEINDNDDVENEVNFDYEETENIEDPDSSPNESIQEQAFETQNQERYTDE